MISESAAFDACCCGCWATLAALLILGLICNAEMMVTSETNIFFALVRSPAVGVLVLESDTAMSSLIVPLKQIGEARYDIVGDVRNFVNLANSVPGRNP